MACGAALFVATRRFAAFLDRHAPYVLAASLLPAGVDWAGDVAGWWVNTPVSRLLTGGVFGLAAGLYLTRRAGGEP